MATKQVCINSLSKTAKEFGLTEAEKADLIKEFEAELAIQKADNMAASLEEQMAAAADDVAKRKLREAYQKKREAAINLRVLLNNIEDITSEFNNNNFAMGVQAFLLGTVRSAKGGRASIANRMRSLRSFYLRGLISKLEDKKLLDAFNRDNLDDQFYALAYERVGKSDPDVEITDEAREIFKIVDELKQMARRNENAAGADIADLPEHMFQTHDSHQMTLGRDGSGVGRAQAKREWMDMVREELDVERTVGSLDEDDIQDFLSSFYDATVSGVHLQTMGNQTGMAKAVGNLARGRSKARVLHFKSSRGAAKYNATYGRQNFRESIMFNLDLSARNTVIMKHLGTNPEQGYRNLIQHLKNVSRRKLSDPENFGEFNKLTKDLEAAIKADPDMARAQKALDDLAEYPVPKKVKEAQAKLDALIASSSKASKIKAKLDKLTTADTKTKEAIQQDIDLLNSHRSFMKFTGDTLDNEFKWLAGATSGAGGPPGRHMTGYLGAIVRNVISMASLGRATLTAFSDIATIGAELRPDRSVFSAYREAFGRIAAGIGSTKVVTTPGERLGSLKLPFLGEFSVPKPFKVTGKPFTADERQLLHMIGGITEALSATPGLRATGDDYFPGALSEWVQSFYKLNLLTQWTDTLRGAAQLMMSQDLAAHVGKSFDSLPAHTRDFMTRFNITPERWDLISKNVDLVELEDGRRYLTPEAIKAIPRQQIERAMINEELVRIQQQIDRNKSGLEKAKAAKDEKRIKRNTENIERLEKKATKLKEHDFVKVKKDGTEVDNFAFKDDQFDQFRQELEIDLRNYFIDRSETAVIQPDARVESLTRAGMPPGTPGGEALRFFYHFKTFPMAIAFQRLNRDFFSSYAPGEIGAGPMSMWRSMRDGKADMRGMAQFFVASSIFGYLRMMTADLLDGRTPRDPTDPNTFMAAALTGGALGIYGDFLFGTQNRFGQSPLVSILGPTAGRADAALDLFFRARNAALDQDNADFSAQALKFMRSNTPFANLFYTKPALDYLIIHQLQEAMNPGYLKRMERRIKENNAQEFYLAPSEVNEALFK